MLITDMLIDDMPRERAVFPNINTPSTHLDINVNELLQRLTNQELQKLIENATMTLDARSPLKRRTR